MLRFFRGSDAVSVLLAASVLLYSAWLTEFLLMAGPDPLHTYVSGLAALDMPHGALYRTTDLLAGICAIAATALPLPGSPARRPWVSAGWWAFGVFGAATVMDSRFPLSCRLVADRACYDRDAAGLAPVAHSVHATTSAVATAAALAAMTALTVAARRYGLWPALARHGHRILLAQWAVNVWLMIATFSFMGWHINPWVGLAERLQELLLAAWTLLLAASLARRHPCDHHRRPGVLGA
ncbi:DUF998 domain-containing protein [Streptomyces sp. NPDC048111]|uniref:DUF998 domain-containing protein n=1 Tax=Streptomyces sp. NPDC048111 TaxID=3365500 RepID=UPI003713EB0C